MSPAPSSVDESAGLSGHAYLVEMYGRRKTAEDAGGSDSWTAGYWEGRIDEYARLNGTLADELTAAREEAYAETAAGGEPA